jgi:RNA polymerase sigma factor for flagellar operon FliA
MVSHPTADGGDFLPSDKNKSNSDGGGGWAIEAMLHYKQTGCLLTRQNLLIYYMETFVARLASKIASSVQHGIEQDDLKQAAFFALDSYIDKFDPSLNYKFESFARLRIEGAMYDYLRREDPASRLARSRTKTISKGVELFSAMHGRKPTDNELQQTLNLNEDEFLAVMRDCHVPTTIPFNSIDNNGDNDGLMSTPIEIELKNSGCDKVDRKDLQTWLCETLGTYDKLIVALTYVEGLTMLETGNSIGYSESRVSQRLKHIQSVLKEKITDEQGDLWLRAS